MYQPSGISILIVEDEAIVAADLQESLEQEGYIITGIASDAMKALKLYHEADIDLVLLDINIKGEWDGIETAGHLMAIKKLPFIYLTAYADEATFERAKATHPASYLLKPFQLTSLRMAIELAFNNFRNQQTANLNDQLRTGEVSPDKNGNDYLLRMHNAVFIRHGNRHVKVKLDDIIYLSADSNHVQIHTPDNFFILRRSMQNLLDELHDSTMLRVHRSYAINSSFIEKIKRNQVFVSGQSIPIGRSYKELFMQQVKLL
jgi:DNA-binding LytR/AlgR family response regulator